MANVDNPNGFRCYDALTGEIALESGTLAVSQTITKGDALIISSGQLQIAVSTSGTIHGVAAESVTTGPGSTASILYYPIDHNNRFEGQCSGTFAESLIGSMVDIEGTTGIMEVNEDATTEQVFVIQGYVKDGTNEIGANTRVFGDFVRSSYLPLRAAV